MKYFSKNTFILPIVLFYGRRCVGGDGELSLTVPVEDWGGIYKTMRSSNYAGVRFLEKFGDYLNLFYAPVGSTDFKPLQLETVNGEVLVNPKIWP